MLPIKKRPILPLKRQRDLEKLSFSSDYPANLFVAANILSGELRRNEAHPFRDFLQKTVTAGGGRDPVEAFLEWAEAARSVNRPAPTLWPAVPEAVRAFGPKSVQLLYVDPPWSYLIDKSEALEGVVGNHYETLSDESIFGLMDEVLDPYLADDCILCMWATGPKMTAALATMARWNFEFKNKLCYWLKTYPNGNACYGLGNYTRTCVEELLLGVRGRGLLYLDHAYRTRALQVLETKEREPPVYPHVRGAHSEKPDMFRNYIAKLFSGAEVKMELFARKSTPGFVPWGDQVPTHKQTSITQFLKK